MAERLLRAHEAFEALEVSEATGWRLIHRGELAVVRIGRAVRVHPEALAAFVRDRTSGGRSPASAA